MSPAPQQSHRLPEGGQVDRAQPLRFRFDGREWTGLRGDTLASALLANGVRVVARSFKYHRPRGIYSAGEEEPCALVEVGEGARRTPSCRAPAVPLTDGLVARSQHAWPSRRFDLGRVIDYTHALWPAGFYNKTFMWPSWHTWEGLVRRTAGLGRAPESADPDRYEQVNAHCDLLICGAGPAGLLAALAAGRAGWRVIVADQDTRPGGSLNWENVALDDLEGAAWAQRVAAELQNMPGVLLLTGTAVTAVFDHNVTTLLQTAEGRPWRECLWTVRPRRVLLATGAIEQGLLFPHNDRPGIMLAASARQYLNRYAVAAGRQALVATNNDSAYQTAADLDARGIEVAAVVDQRESIGAAAAAQMAERGIAVFRGARIADTRGDRGLREASIERLDGRLIARFDCDLLAVSGGWAPRVHLLSQARGRLRFDAVSQSFVPDRLPPGFSVAGTAGGAATLEESLAQAARAIADIADALGRSAPAVDAPRVSRGLLEAAAVDPQRVRRTRSRQWIDLAHDVTLDDAELAVREGYSSVEHFKRYTTTGMSVDQGKTGNLNAFIVLGELSGRDPGEVGTTTFRPPYVPVTLGAVAGRSVGEFYAPRRELPARAVHDDWGARFEDYGWQRPDFYPAPGEEPEQSIRREVLAVRNAAGVFDNSPIGKLEVSGPDAARFLDRLYINRVDNLAVGRCRYGLMMNENGVILDDGVFTRLAEDRFLVNTTSAGVARIGDWMEEWLQCEWPDLQVLVDDVTSQWANFTLAGPRAREVLAALGTDIDLAPGVLPHMAAAAGTVGGMPARLIRVSFSGECSFEINVPAARGAQLLRALGDAGKAFGLVPYGIEALMRLRLEKGYLHVGSDTDGGTTPDDVGWGDVARRKAGDCIGRRSLDRAANRDPNRRQLVGLEPLDDSIDIRAGGHLLLGANRQPPAPTDGWITSAGYSPTLGRVVALGMLAGGRARVGETVTVVDESRRLEMRVVSPVFYDPRNEKLEA